MTPSGRGHPRVEGLLGDGDHGGGGVEPHFLASSDPEGLWGLVSPFSTPRIEIRTSLGLPRSSRASPSTFRILPSTVCFPRPGFPAPARTFCIPRSSSFIPAWVFRFPRSGFSIPASTSRIPACTCRLEPVELLRPGARRFPPDVDPSGRPGSASSSRNGASASRGGALASRGGGFESRWSSCRSPGWTWRLEVVELLRLDGQAPRRRAPPHGDRAFAVGAPGPGSRGSRLLCCRQIGIPSGRTPTSFIRRGRTGEGHPVGLEALRPRVGDEGRLGGDRPQLTSRLRTGVGVNVLEVRRLPAQPALAPLVGHLVVEGHALHLGLGYPS